MKENISISHFWAKTSKNKNYQNAFHPLVCHLIDVAVSAQAIWDNVLTDTQKQRLAKPFRLEDDDNLKTAGTLFAFLIGLHDLGKCSPPFALRGKNEPDRQTATLYELYKNSDFDLPTCAKAADARHEFVTSIILPPILREKFNFSEELAKSVSDVIGGHHGNFPTRSFQEDSTNTGEQVCGNDFWRDAQREIVEFLANELKVERNFPKLQKQKLDNATAMIFAGFVTAADWVGSNEKFFPCEIENSTNIANDKNFPIRPDEYIKKSREKAREALKTLGWLDWVSVTKEKRFEELFPKLEELRHLQKVAIEIADDIREMESPGIVVIEEQMGKGKTETAMFLADVFNAVLKQRGIYFALPTQATSNQMFGRVKNFLEHKHAGEKANVQLHLHHGHSSISEEFDKNIKDFKNLYAIFDESETREDFANVVAAEWFTYKKRGLFVPFGVGTIDQILLGVLQVKHVFVRLFGLAHKTIIIDEVHAYDAYMSVLLERLLEWLAALGSPVIILSATLPQNRRTALIKAYLRGLNKITKDEIPTSDDEDKYPRISYATGKTEDKKFKIRHLGYVNRPSKTLSLEWKKRDNFVTDLKERLNENKGCVAIICNTVKEAQEIYSELAADKLFQGNSNDGLPKLDLLHARFRFIERDERDRCCLKRFGKPKKKKTSDEDILDSNENTGDCDDKVFRPDFAVLISTQIIEQSLDLDFDLMISYLAPADLLLQRSGRLQRHKRPERILYKNTPTLWILEPDINENGRLLIEKNLPDFGLSGVVYDKHILLRTWLKLRGENKIEIPRQIEQLVEDVYREERQCFDESYLDIWEETKADLKDKVMDKKQKAKAFYLAEVDHPDIFNSFKHALDEDDPEKHSTLRAQTRDDERPSVAVVLLTRKEANSINLESEPNDETEEFLIMREVKFSRFVLTREILKNPKYKQKSWEKSALLRHHRLLILEENNELMVGRDKIVLDKNRGVVFETEGGNK
ncbi:MAG: CRISPR-associated helicase Cas3' [Acidobacteriota bacterium]|nr:CRISPR-associated helicase Cas3' [Acidobacteriota bacterium]